MRKLSWLLTLIGCLFLPAAAGAATIPTTGALLRAPVDIQGVCQRQTPDYPDTTNWGPEHDGTPYHGTYVFSSFAAAKGDTLWPAPNNTFAIPPADGEIPDNRPCDFGYADGKTVYETHLVDPGAWVMTVTTETYDEHYDSVNGWISEPDDMSTTTKTVFFQVAAHNSCHNGWFGTVPGTVACLNDDEKSEAVKSERQYKQAYQEASETYAGLGCGPGVTPNGEHPVHSGNIGRETAGACLAASAMRIYNSSMLAEASALADDPPVKNYKSVAKPTKLKSLLRFTGIPASDYAVRDILTAYASIPGLCAAIATTNNRANGAFVAGDATWVERQTDAADDYAEDVQIALETISGSASDARQELKALHASPKLLKLFGVAQTKLSKSLSGLAS